MGVWNCRGLACEGFEVVEVGEGPFSDAGDGRWENDRDDVAASVEGFGFYGLYAVLDGERGEGFAVEDV